jgi:hypothetical protein
MKIKFKFVNITESAHGKMVGLTGAMVAVPRISPAAAAA